MIYLTKAVDLTLESLYSGPALRRAIWRYEALWLPILAAVSAPPAANEGVWTVHSFGARVSEIRSKNFAKGGLWLSRRDLVPPLDIAWVWHVHRLQPEEYAKDLERFGVDDRTKNYFKEACRTELSTAFKFSDGEDSQSRRTRRLWEIVYPYERFMPAYLLSCSYEEEERRKRREITSYTNEITRLGFRSNLKYDLEQAAELQKAFLYQIVDENDTEASETFETNQYLYKAWARYLLFISLHDHAQDVFLVPMNDINIIWHMHLSATTEYEKDCKVIVGRIIKHDSIAVEQLRIKQVQEMEAEQAANGTLPLEQDTLEEDELADLMEKRGRGISIKETKAIWESQYGSKPRYDTVETRYRGQPKGERGGFKEVFEKTNGTTRDITWTETLSRMLLAFVVFVVGVILLCVAFIRAMRRHGIYLLGLPVGAGVMGLGLFIFLAIPISRPLSSESRYWLEKSYMQTHNALQPYLVSSGKKTS